MSVIRSIGSRARTLISPARRARLRGSRLVDGVLRALFAGPRSRPHPHAPGYQVVFDGYRNLGWNFGSLDQAERSEIAFAARQVEALRPACVWDVGANVGFWTVYFASVRPAIPAIVSFEPDPVNRGLLARACRRNRIAGVRVRPVALSEESGTMTFHADPVTGATGSLEAGESFLGSVFGAGTTRITVQVSTVDAEVAAGTPAPQFMKIDVEGHELAVLRGAARTLREHRPTLIMEITRHQDEVGRLLREAGYRLVDPADGRELATPAFATAAIPVDGRELATPAFATAAIPVER